MKRYLVSALLSAAAIAGAGTLAVPTPVKAQVLSVGIDPFLFGGSRYCWYQGWNGPGWYRCGYGWRRGYGWGGGYGWRGHGGPAGWRGYHGGGYHGYHRGRYDGGGYHDGGNFHGGNHGGGGNDFHGGGDHGGGGGHGGGDHGGGHGGEHHEALKIRNTKNPLPRNRGSGFSVRKPR